MAHCSRPLQMVLELREVRINYYATRHFTHIYLLSPSHTHTHTQDVADKPPTKKLKREKQTKGEKAVEKAIESFTTYQREAEGRFQRYEDERWKKELEVEETRRKEDREHEMRMMAMLGQMFQGRHSSSSDSFNFEDYPSNYYQH